MQGKLSARAVWLSRWIVAPGQWELNCSEVQQIISSGKIVHEWTCFFMKQKKNSISSSLRRWNIRDGGALFLEGLHKFAVELSGKRCSRQIITVGVPWCPHIWYEQLWFPAAPTAPHGPPHILLPLFIWITFKQSDKVSCLNTSKQQEAGKRKWVSSTSRLSAYRYKLFAYIVYISKTPCPFLWIYPLMGHRKAAERDFFMCSFWYPQGRGWVYSLQILRDACIKPWLV